MRKWKHTQHNGMKIPHGTFKSKRNSQTDVKKHYAENDNDDAAVKEKRIQKIGLLLVTIMELG